MSLPNSHRPARGSPQTPATQSTPSTPVEPKSEYLRFALDAKRAKNATLQQSTPTSETKPRQPSTLRASSSDPWLDQAKSEDDAAQPTPIRRSRRPSDGGIPRMRTQRELQVETDKMKEVIFSLNMKLELIRKQNNDLKDQVEEANKRIEELEDAEEENHELREKNERLTLKLQNVTEEAVELRDQNFAILKIQEETVANMEKEHSAVEEATEIIIQLEEEKRVLAEENARLKDQLEESQTTSSGAYHTAVDGTTNKYPSRVYSIDESRPSTSHFDSDYYSQPASPHVKSKSSKESLANIALSDRAKNFLSLKKDGHKSIQDLKKRMSDASLKSVRPVGSVPEVPPIPESYQGPPQSQPQEQSKKPASRTPRRSKPFNQLSPAPVGQEGSRQTTNAAPRTPTGPNEGLRGMYRECLTLDTSSYDSQPAPSYNNSPLSTRASRPSCPAERPTPPDRHSSRHATHSSSREQLQNLAKAQFSSESQLEAETEASEWAEIPPPPSIISDLTTELDHDTKDKWWKDVARVQHGAAKGDYALSLAMGGARVAAPRAGMAGPYMQQDFFFNGGESEEDFVRRAQGYMKKR
ncbi:hypothetical protein K458DRAFT_140062 [Lentithecium fluviatile CBS 122367]|uniref:Uncharacterized protein n=1 Tax=Lentithecium fluviatile CBS 122367 TaxID=1168545 RepID=A0A6G1IJH1_9PLEO|nr:hypothetical protein K458DRAFT_140062 [Lentithecium fluviatile CBS 122367]